MLKICKPILFSLMFGFPYSADAMMALNNSEDPILIIADKKLEWIQEESKYLAIGQAKISQNEYFAYGDVFHAFYNQTDQKKEIYLIEGQKDIHLEHVDNHAYGQKLHYDLTKGIIKLTEGDLKFITPSYTVTAYEHLAFHEFENKAVATGSARAVKEESVILSDTLIAWLKENAEGSQDVSKTEAIGHVKITTKEDIAYGDRAEHFADQDKAYLYDNVRLIRGKNKIMGSKAEIDLKTGQSKLLSEPKQRSLKNDQSESRVRGIIHLGQDAETDKTAE